MSPDRDLSELSRKLNQGEISRREFLRTIALLGLSLGSAETLSACGLQTTPTPYPTAYNPAPDDPALLTAAAPLKQGAGGASSTEAGAVVGPVAGPTTAPPKNIAWLCTACDEHFSSEEALKKHAAAVHATRLPEIQRVDQPTYSEFLVGEVERFDERNTIFSRLAWDTAYAAQVQAAAAKAPQGGWEAVEGQALVAGGIYVDDTAGNLHPAYFGYFGHMQESDGLYGWDDAVNETRFPVPDPAWMTERIKDVARFYGADLVGITQVNPLWVYSHYFELATGKYGVIEMPYRWAIVMGIEMDWQGINETPRYPASAATALAYSQMAELTASLAKYIRALGYPALPCGNDTGQSIPLAIDAGLGEFGRNGLLLTPEYGPRQRLCKVFTDLPLLPDKPVDFGQRSFCENCHACAGACPVDAIPRGDRSVKPTSISNRTGILRWTVDVERCYLFWQENGTDCSNCIASCPWALQNPRDWLEL